MTRCAWWMLRICLIFPNIFYGNYLKINIPTHPPLSLAYLGAILRKEGHDVHVIDAAAEDLSFPRLVDRLAGMHLGAIGITTNISISRKAVITARYIKKFLPGIPIIMGGPWATIEYDMILRRGICDFVVHGEGEYTTLDLLAGLKDKGTLKDVKGISFLDEKGLVITTPTRELITELDALPFPAWDLLPPSKKYTFPHQKVPYYPIMTTRGCAYDCIHCTKIVHGYKYRKRSVENVIQELKYLKEKFGAKEIFIIDDNFNQDIERAERILDEIIKNQFNFRIKFSNGIRADKITPRLGRKLKAAGTYAAALGIESGNQDIVNRIGKKLDLRKVIKATRILKQNKIITAGFFILGHPYDNYTTMLETLNFAKALDLDYPHFFKAIPFPGTKMYDLIREQGHFIPGGKEEAIEGYSIKAVNFEIWNLKMKDIEKAFKLSYRWFYLRPRKVIQLIGQFRVLSEVWWAITSFIKFILVNLF